MANPNCCFMIIAVTFFFSSPSPRGTVNCLISIFCFVGNSNDKDNQDLWEELEETPIEVDEFDSLFSRPQVKNYNSKYFLFQLANFHFNW